MEYHGISGLCCNLEYLNTIEILWIFHPIVHPYFSIISPSVAFSKRGQDIGRSVEQPQPGHGCRMAVWSPVIDRIDSYGCCMMNSLRWWLYMVIICCCQWIFPGIHDGLRNPRMKSCFLGGKTTFRTWNRPRRNLRPGSSPQFFSMATELLRQFRALCSACTSILSTRKIPTFTVLQCSIVLPLLNYCYHLGCHNDVHTDHWQSFATPKFANQSSFEQSFSHHNLLSWSTNFQTHPHHHNIYIYCLSMPICIPSW